MLVIVLLALVIGLICLLDHYKRHYWARRGIPQTPSTPFLGHFSPVVKLTGAAVEVYDEACKNAKGQPYVGIYEFWRPTLVVQDVQLIEQILIKNFSNFLDHPQWIFDSKSFVHEGLFKLNGNKWRALRYHTIPWFTTGRMKSLFPSVHDCTLVPEEQFNGLNFCRKISSETIAAFFGVKICDKEKFDKEVKNFHDPTTFRFYKLLMIEHFSKISERLGLTFTSWETDNFFRNFVKSSIDNQNYTLSQRFQSLLDRKKIDLRKKDLYTSSQDDEVYSFETTMDLMVATGGQLLIGGMDATAVTTLWLFYDLAMHPEAQTIAREEIRSTLEKHGGWTYDALQDMKYVGNCLNESQRLHPILPFLIRSCTTSFTTSDNLTIEKGTKIIVPGLTIQMDPSIYPEPELFKPERFETITKQTNLTWLPFGEGPRKCLGQRFAQMVIRAAAARVLESHELVFTEKTQLPVVIDKKPFLLRPLQNLYFKLNKVM